MQRRKLIAGNWKMNGTAATLGEARTVAQAAADHPAVDVALCVPAILITRAVAAAPGLAIGGQDVHASPHGAHTGCTSAAMLADAGARLVIVGHSERRGDQHESDADVRVKAAAGLGEGLSVILCVGESEAVRDSGQAVAHVCSQLDASLPEAPADPAMLSIAYEPIWAIGTGKTASPEQAREAADAGAWIAFRKYLVTSLRTESTGGVPDQRVDYEYLDTPAWHYQDSILAGSVQSRAVNRAPAVPSRK